MFYHVEPVTNQTLRYTLLFRKGTPLTGRPPFVSVWDYSSAMAFAAAMAFSWAAGGQSS